MLLGNYVLLQIEGGSSDILGPAQIAPIIFIGAEGEDFFCLGSEAQIGGDDGEGAEK